MARTQVQLRDRGVRGFGADEVVSLTVDGLHATDDGGLTQGLLLGALALAEVVAVVTADAECWNEK